VVASWASRAASRSGRRPPRTFRALSGKEGTGPVAFKRRGRREEVLVLLDFSHSAVSTCFRSTHSTWFTPSAPRRLVLQAESHRHSGDGQALVVVAMPSINPIRDASPSSPVLGLAESSSSSPRIRVVYLAARDHRHRGVAYVAEPSMSTRSEQR
jgi:hypothetical protein